MTEPQQPMTAEQMAAIGQALDAATPGPWKIWKRSDAVQVIEQDGPLSVCELDGGTYEEWEKNAHLIANAPTWLQSLLSEVHRLQSITADYDVLARDMSTEVETLHGKLERQQGEIERLQLMHGNMQRDRDHIYDDFHRLRQKLGEAVEVLEWYGVKRRYSSAPRDPEVYPYQQTPEVYDDGGERARKALAHLKGDRTDG